MKGYLILLVILLQFLSVTQGNFTVTQKRNCITTAEFTDDDNNRFGVCPGNTFATRFLCNGSNCDNNWMECCEFVLKDGTSARRGDNCEVIDGRTKSRLGWPRNKFITKATCYDRYCDFRYYDVCEYTDLFKDPLRRGRNVFTLSDEYGWTGCDGATAVDHSRYTGNWGDNLWGVCVNVLDISSKCDRCNPDVWTGPRNIHPNDVYTYGVLACTHVFILDGNADACKIKTQELGAHGFNINYENTRCYIKKCDGDDRKYVDDAGGFYVYEYIPDTYDGCNRVQTGCKTPDVDHCLPNNRKKNKCLACHTDYKLESDATCSACNQASPNCNRPNTAFCSSKGYYKRCFDCAFKYTLDGQNDCVLCSSLSANCAEVGYANSCVCTGCNSGYKLDASNNCIQCSSIDSPNCSNKRLGTCTAIANAYWAKCNTCDSGFKLDINNDSCQECNGQTPNCDDTIDKTCSVNGYYRQCSECSFSYTLDGGNNCVQCPGFVSNCVSVESPNSCVCSACEPGYKLNDAKTCVRCSSVSAPNCATINSGTCTEIANAYWSKCSVCDDGFKLDSNDDSCQICDGVSPNCDVPNDKTCSSKGYYATCNQCDFSYTQDGESDCIPCPSFPANCATLEAVNSCSCATCDPGYKLNDSNECILCSSISSPDCNVVVDGSCTDIDDSYWPKCSECNFSHKLDPENDSCQDCLEVSPNCDTINATHCSLKDYYKRCQFCSLGHTLDEQGDCEACPGFDSNCSEVEYANSCVCSDCKSGYKLNDFKECILCSSITSPDCDSIDPGTCTEKVDSYWSKCSTCNDGFKLDVDSDTCQTCNGVSPDCDVINNKTCSSKGYYATCAECIFSYTQDGESDCILCPSFPANCATLEAVNSCSCATCDPGYKLNDSNECILCSSISSPDCDVVVDGSCTDIDDSYWPKCSECDSRYKLDSNNDTCQACLQDSPNCDSINTTHCSLKDYYKRCQFCSLGYTLDEQGDCEVCPGFVSNCTKVDYANSCECSECQSGHKLNDSKECILCSSISSPDCDSIDPGTCTEINDSYWSKCSICNAGFKLDVNSDTCQECNGVSPNCDISNDKTCSSKGYYQTCSECSLGYTQDGESDCISCSSFPSNCTTVEEANSCSCATCEYSYKLNDSNECILCSSNTSPNCDVVVPGSCTDIVASYWPKCNECNAGYKLDIDNDTCQECSEVSPNCDNPTIDVCSSKGYYDVCTECSFGFTQDEENDCVSCPAHDPNCVAVENINSCACTGCLSGYKLNDVNQCVLCSSISSPNCDTVDDGSCTDIMGAYWPKCIECDIGYKLDINDDSCQACNNTAPDCLVEEEITCTLNTGYYPNCSICHDGFYMGLIQNCLACPNEVPHCGDSENTTCLVAGPYKQCNACEPGYKFSGDLCQECTIPSNCIEWRDGTCVEVGYFQECSQCHDDYYIDSNNLCEDKIYCDGECLNGGDCDITVGKCVCTDGFYGENCERCQAKDDKCQVTDDVWDCKPGTALAKCVECHDGNYLQDDSCHVCQTGDIANIGDCLDNSTVKTCFDTTTLITCSVCSDNHWLDGNDFCNECQTDAIANTGFCFDASSVTYCLDSTSQIKCNKCLDTHWLDDDNFCQEKIPCIGECLNGGYCDVRIGVCDCPYSNFGDNCELCRERARSCANHLPSFGRCADNSNYVFCLDCNLGYYVAEGGHCEPLSPGCSVGVKDQCLKCFSDNAFIIGGECVCFGDCDLITECNEPHNCISREEKCIRNTNNHVYHPCKVCANGYFVNHEDECIACEEVDEIASQCKTENLGECTREGYLCDHCGCAEGSFNTNDTSICSSCSDGANCNGPESVKECACDGSVLDCVLTTNELGCKYGYFNTPDNYTCRPYESFNDLGHCTDIIYMFYKQGEMQIYCRRGQCYRDYENVNYGVGGICTKSKPCKNYNPCEEGGDYNSECTPIDDDTYDCKCSEGYNFDNVLCTTCDSEYQENCAVCSSLVGCLSCKPGMANTTSNCTDVCTMEGCNQVVCLGNQSLTPSCNECSDGYFPNEINNIEIQGLTNCTSCTSGCEECSGPKNCQRCASGLFWDFLTATCGSDCSLGLYPNTDNYLCEDCHHSCAACTTSSLQNCSSCENISGIEYDFLWGYNDSITLLPMGSCLLASSQSDNGMSAQTSIIISAVFGVIVGIALISLMVIFVVKRRNKDGRNLDILPEGLSPLDFVLGKTAAEKRDDRAKKQESIFQSTVDSLRKNANSPRAESSSSPGIFAGRTRDYIYDPTEDNRGMGLFDFKITYKTEDTHPFGYEEESSIYSDDSDLGSLNSSEYYQNEAVRIIVPPSAQIDGDYEYTPPGIDQKLDPISEPQAESPYIYSSSYTDEESGIISGNEGDLGPDYEDDIERDYESAIPEMEYNADSQDRYFYRSPTENENTSMDEDPASFDKESAVEYAMPSEIESNDYEYSPGPKNEYDYSSAI